MKRRKNLLLAICSFLVMSSVSVAQAYLVSDVAGGGLANPTVGSSYNTIDLNLSYSKIDNDGYIYVIRFNTHDELNWNVIRINPYGVIDKIYDFSELDSQLFMDIAIDLEKNIYLPGNNSVYKVTQDGTLSTYAGTGVNGYSGDGGPATEAQIHGPIFSITMDLDNNLYIAQSCDGIIRKVTKDGIITTVFDGIPQDIDRINTLHTDRLGNLFFFNDFTYHIYKLDKQGTLSIVAGNGTMGNYGENIPALEAEIEYVYGITSDDWGNIYLTNDYSGNGNIRKIDAFGIISTVASVPIFTDNFDRLSTDRDGMIYITAYDYSTQVKRLAFAPEINMATPDPAAIGERVKLSGRYFTGQGAVGTVTFAGIEAPILFWSNDTIVCTVPAGVSKTVDVVVTAPDGQTSNPFLFRIK